MTDEATHTCSECGQPVQSYLARVPAMTDACFLDKSGPESATVSGWASVQLDEGHLSVWLDRDHHVIFDVEVVS